MWVESVPRPAEIRNLPVTRLKVGINIGKVIYVIAEVSLDLHSD